MTFLIEKITVSFFLHCITYLALVNSIEIEHCCDLDTYSDFSQEQRDSLAPYIMKEEHPAKQVLDKIFSKSNTVTNQEIFHKRGFVTELENFGWSGTVVAMHPKLKGYLVKLFLDEHNETDEISRFLSRIKGAQLARKIIKDHGWGDSIKVPKKWLYLLPSKNGDRKKFILVVEDMEILSKRKSHRKWKSRAVTNHLLKIIYQFVTEGGFYDSLSGRNFPFSKDGRLAMVDTEHHGGGVPYEVLDGRLNPKKLPYWKHITGR